MVDGIVQEEYLRWLNDDVSQRKQACIEKALNACSQSLADHFNNRANAQEGSNRQDRANNTEGEVVNQHFKAGFDFALYGLIELLQNPGRDGTYDHGAHEHRNICTYDDAHRGYSTDHTTTSVVDHLTAGITDENRKKVGDHRAD
ncbi:hypothetical protein D3C87_1662220 [compost metagenome]